MILNYIYTESSFNDKPQNIDDKMSKKYVYIRRNINKVTKTLPDTPDDTITIWTYEEAKVKKSDWEMYKIEILKDLEMLELQHMITDMDIQNIKTEQYITDMDLRLLEIEVN